jgi:AcrR family transcriptional regulator
VLDEDRLLDAAAEILAEVGPATFTLARAAERAGVSAATFVKRFGSKHELFAALNRRWARTVVAGIDSAIAASTGIDCVRAAALWGVAELDRPAQAANRLATLALDLTHPDLQALLGQGWAAQNQRITELLAEVRGDGRLPAAPQPDHAARMLVALVEGTKIGWSVNPEGSLEAQVRRHVDALLDSWQ